MAQSVAQSHCSLRWSARAWPLLCSQNHDAVRVRLVRQLIARQHELEAERAISRTPTPNHESRAHYKAVVPAESATDAIRLGKGADHSQSTKGDHVMHGLHFKDDWCSNFFEFYSLYRTE